MDVASWVISDPTVPRKGQATRGSNCVAEEEEEGDPLEDHLKMETPEEIPPVEHDEQEGTLLDEPDHPNEPVEGLDMDESHYQWE